MSIAKIRSPAVLQFGNQIKQSEETLGLLQKTANLSRRVSLSRFAVSFSSVNFRIRSGGYDTAADWARELHVSSQDSSK